MADDVKPEVCPKCGAKTSVQPDDGRARVFDCGTAQVVTFAGDVSNIITEKCRIAALTAQLVTATAERDSAIRQRDEAVAILQKLVDAKDAEDVGCVEIDASIWLAREGLAEKGA